MPKTAYRSKAPLATRGYRLNASERKVNDIAAATYVVNTTGAFTLLALPVTGADMNQRIGRKIQLKSVYIRGHVCTNWAATPVGATSAIATQHCRLIILCDYQPNGAAPAVLDLLATASPLAHLNLNNRDRFKILKDKIYTLGPSFFDTTNQQGLSVAPQILPIKIYKKLNIETIFNATNGGSIADITSGALFMFWIGSTAASATLASTASLSTRVRYFDR